jgi:lipoyl(octanoyl) transferase
MRKVYRNKRGYDCTMSGATQVLQVRDLGTMAYADALALQRQLQACVIAQRETEDDAPAETSSLGYLLLVEHDPPVITISRRKTARSHLIASDVQLAQAGVQVAETDRGGDITYHGPGQLVVYPIVDLNRLGLRLHGYMRLLEQIVIDTLAGFGIDGHRDDRATGVWVETDAAQEWQPPGGEGPSSKICAMGVRVSRWVTMHGLALNVTTNLDHFNLIVPCGLAGRSVTSLQQQLGPSCPDMADVKQSIVDHCAQQMRAAVAQIPLVDTQSTDHSSQLDA